MSIRYWSKIKSLLNRYFVTAVWRQTVGHSASFSQTQRESLLVIRLVSARSMKVTIQ